MFTYDENNYRKNNLLKHPFISGLILPLIISTALSVVIFKILWTDYYIPIHTLLELLCIFVAFTSFLAFWNTSYFESEQNYILIFGFFSVAIFDSLHTYYFIYFKLHSNLNYDLSNKFWVMGRAIEAIIFLFGIKHKNIHRFSKYKGLLVTSISLISISILIIKFQYFLPKLITTDHIVTKEKIIIENFLILVYLISLIRLKTITKYEDKFKYKYISNAIIFAIYAEVFFSLYHSTFSFFYIYGHILRLCCYYFLYKGIIKTSVIYPYKKMEQLYKECENMFQNAMDYFSIGIEFINLNGNFIAVNRHLCNMLGYSEEELLKYRVKDITVNGDKQLDEDIAFKLLNDETNRITF